MTNRADVIRVLNLYYNIPLDVLVNAANEALDYQTLYTANSGHTWDYFKTVDYPRYQKSDQVGDPTSPTDEDTPADIKNEVAQQKETMKILALLVIVALIVFLAIH